MAAEVAAAVYTGGSSAAASGAARSAQAAKAASGAARGAKAARTAKTARQAWSTADALRGQLKSVQMRQTGNRAVDDQSGRTYTVHRRGPQTIYQPDRRNQ